MEVSTNRQKAWEVLAQTWVDTSYDAEQRESFARELAGTGFSARELRHIAYWEVSGAFATFSTAVFATAGMALPDWYYPEDAAREKVAAWVSRPIILSLLNPFWLLGYPLSVGIMRSTMGPVLSAVARRA